MENSGNLKSEFDTFETIKRNRKKLLPWWIKGFSWIFLIFGAIATILFLAGFLGVYASLSLYGLESSDPHSITGLIIISIFIVKGVIAYNLLFEKDKAIIMAKVEAFIGIIICLLVMIVIPIISEKLPSFDISIIILIVYFLKLYKLEKAWN